MTTRIYIHNGKKIKVKDAGRISKAKDSEYEPLVETMPVAINGKKFRPKVMKNGLKIVWVGTNFYATETEALAEAKRQIAKATQDSGKTSDDVMALRQALNAVGSAHKAMTDAYSARDSAKLIQLAGDLEQIARRIKENSKFA